MKIEWQHIRNTASDIFNIWVNRPELRWAEDAWSRLDSEGLTSYENELEKHIVLVRFFVLGTIYHEFCQVAFQESATIEYSLWAETLDAEELFLSTFRLGQLLGSNFMTQEIINDLWEEEALRLKFIGSLVEQQRKVVVSALTNSFGGESMLFAHLWLSPRSNFKQKNYDHDEDYYDNEDYYDDAIEDALGYVTLDKMAAFAWITEGMPEINGSSYVRVEEFNVKQEESNIKQLIAAGESETVEFKQGACLSPHQNKKDMSMVDKVVKTVAAFMNSKGGKLLIGIADDGAIVGIEREYEIANPQKASRDGYELFLRDVLRTKIDNGLIHLLYKIKFYSIDKKDVCVIEVDPAPNHTYVSNEFHVREGNRSIALTGKSLVEHIRNVGKHTN